LFKYFADVLMEESFQKKLWGEKVKIDGRVFLNPLEQQQQQKKQEQETAVDMR